jgi:DNA polymerase-1
VFWWCLGLRSWNFYDGSIVEKLLLAGLVTSFETGYFSMDGLVKKYARLEIDKTLQTSFDLESELTEDQLTYCALDCRLPFAIRAGQKPIVEKADLETTASLENACIGAFGDMHLNGFYLHVPAWVQLAEEIQQQHELNVKTLDYYFLPVVGKKEKPTIDLVELEEIWKAEADKEERKLYREQFYAARRKANEWRDNSAKWEGEAAINYGSGDQLKAALAKLGIKLSDTNDKTLQKLASKHPVIKALQNYRDSKKKLDTYGVEFVTDYVNPVTGRIHSSINQLGAATGRTSSSKPNIQNIPKDQRYRRCFRSRPGYKLIKVDMSGAELRIIAEMSGDLIWIEAFQKGWDVHSIGAEMMKHDEWVRNTLADCSFAANKTKCKCPEHGKIRDANKTINFGVAYGMEEQSLADKLGISRMAARALLELWRKVNGNIDRFLKALGDKVKRLLEARTIGGRRRLFTKPTWESARIKAINDAKKYKREFQPSDVGYAYGAMYAMIERQGKNMPIQGTNADILKVALGSWVMDDGFKFMWHWLWDEFRAEIVNVVHDEFVVECPDEFVEQCYDRIGEAINRAGAVFLKLVSMEFEGAYADYWKK